MSDRLQRPPAIPMHITAREAESPRSSRGLGAVLRALSRLLVLVPFVLLVAGTAHADVVHMKDGRRLEGKITKETKSELVVETRAGTLTVARADVREIVRGNTPRQEFDARFKAAKTADELFELAEWAEKQKLRTQFKKCMRRIVELDANNERAHTALGHVLYRGEWLTVRERGKRAKADEEAEAKAKGLVRHDGRWVTAQDKERLEKGLIQVAGEWLTVAESKRREGLADLDGEWVPLVSAEAVRHARSILAAGGAPGAEVLGANVVVAGPIERTLLAEIQAGIDAGRTRFDGQFADVPGGLELLGGRPAAFFVFGRDSTPYRETVDELAALTTTVGPEWQAAVADTHGYVFWDPFAVSSVRAVGRPEFHLAGHCYYHWGHVLLNRHQYDGRLLPPWFGEGYASLMEWWTHGKNTVVLKAAVQSAGGGTVAKRKDPPFGRASLTRGDWQTDLRLALEENDARLESFDKLAQKSPGALTAVDVAMSMGVVLWLCEAKEGALDRFHASLKASAPVAPAQVLEKGAERQRRYDEAFQAAVSMKWKDADRAWRRWFLKTR